MAGRLLDAARTARPPEAVAPAVEAFRAHYADPAAPPTGEAQVANVVAFYDLVTDFYEYGWGQSFHFAVRRPGDRLDRAIEAHEAWIGTEARLGPGVRALDLGCGVGGPMRFLARTTGAHITGVNLNRTQIGRARERAAAAGLGDRVAVVEADFAALPFPDASFDAVYAIEATCHAPDRRPVFAEAFRVLKPGGRFVGYEWCLTDRHDPSRPDHVAALRDIEEGNALPPSVPTAVVDDAIRGAGFTLLEGRDVAADCHPDTAWYMALEGDGGLRAWPRTTLGRRVTGALVRGLEAVRLAPRGSTEVSDLLNRAADGLVAGGRLGTFTVMYRFSAVKGG